MPGTRNLLSVTCNPLPIAHCPSIATSHLHSCSRKPLAFCEGTNRNFIIIIIIITISFLWFFVGFLLMLVAFCHL